VAKEARRLRDVARRMQDERDGQELEQVDRCETGPASCRERQRHHREHDPAAHTKPKYGTGSR
jgi:hypothetical protein